MKPLFLYGTKLHTVCVLDGKTHSVGALSGNAGKLRKGLFVLYVKQAT